MRAAIFGVMAVALAGPVSGAEPCAFKNAIYGQESSGFVLSFQTIVGVEDAAANMTNRFAVTAPSVTEKLIGEVYWPNGMGGDQTSVSVDGCVPPVDDGEDACLVWDGKLYALGDHTATGAPDEDAPAPEAILLAGFGGASYYTVPHDGPVQVAEDVFMLRGCAP